MVMAVPFFTECPECAAQLKINNPTAIGKRVRCPNCKNVFQTNDSRTATPPPPPPSKDFDYEDPDEGFYDDEYDDYAPNRGAEHRSRPRQSKSSNTLLIVGIIFGCFVVFGGLLAAFLLPAVGQARMAAQRSMDKNNLKQVGIALHNYHDNYGAFPVIREEDHNGPRPMPFPLQQHDPAGGQRMPPHLNRQLSWRVHILPFIDQAPLYERFHLDEPWDSPHNRTLIPLMPEVYKRPGSNLPQGKTTYLGIDGPGGVMEDGGGTSIREITDGASNTILIVEVADENAVTWTQPEDYHFTPQETANGLGGWPGGFHVLMCDGSVRFVSEQISPQTLAKLMQKNDGQIIEQF